MSGWVPYWISLLLYWANYLNCSQSFLETGVKPDTVSSTPWGILESSVGFERTAGRELFSCVVCLFAHSIKTWVSHVTTGEAGWVSESSQCHAIGTSQVWGPHLCTLAWEMHAQKGELGLFGLIWYTLASILRMQLGTWALVYLLTIFITIELYKSR